MKAGDATPRAYTVDVCSKCLEQVDLDQTAYLSCPRHPRAQTETLVISTTLTNAAAWLRETKQRDEELAEQIRRGEV